jgi:heat shock protein HslJ
MISEVQPRTMMVCADSMDTEKAFLQAPGQVNTGKITGTQLELFDIEARVVARLGSRHMK